jgi:hypothetical protein
MTLLTLLLGCAEPVLATDPTEARFERFCRADNALEAKEAELLSKAFIQEVLLKDGWRYAGPLHNDGINCTVTLWLR